MSTPEHSPLGKNTIYADRYDPGLLFPIPRQGKRDEIGVSEPLPFHGVDIWNAYELSWLDMHGKPIVALAEFRVPATSPNIIESKSFKLYLNGFSQEPLANTAALRALLQQDLSVAAGAPVDVQLHPARVAQHTFADLAGESIDALPVTIDDYGPPQADYLHADAGAAAVEETLVSDLLRSNCPVTGQPDWGSVQIAYRGTPIDREGLLRYLVSFRNHNEFHEQCVERIYVDVLRRCKPERLSVYARYTRRGGLDINPFRSSEPMTSSPAISGAAASDAPAPGNARGARQ